MIRSFYYNGEKTFLQLQGIWRVRYYALVNETLLVVRALLDFGIVLLAFRLGRPYLYATIIINLLLIALLGAKLQVLFGYITNVGNVPYAAVFFAIFLLLEHDTPQAAARAIWIGISAVVSFLVLMELTLLLQSPAQTQEFSTLMNQVLGVTPRIALASLTGYLVTMHLIMWLYMHWEETVGRPHWWLRVISVTLAAQLVDTVIFFSIAFAGMVTSSMVFESIIVGYIIKISLGVLSTPFIYLTHKLVQRSAPVQIRF